jgi:hypothetical protein
MKCVAELKGEINTKEVQELQKQLRTIEKDE